MRLRYSLAAVALLAGGIAAHADSFNFTLTGAGGGFSGSGTLTVASTATPGKYQVTGITGAGTSGPIAVNGYNLNDNFFYAPGSTYFSATGSYFDLRGLSFYDQNSSGVYQVRLFGALAGFYFADYKEINTTGFDRGVVPVSFTATAVTPEPSSLLLLGTGVAGVLGAARRRLFA